MRQVKVIKLSESEMIQFAAKVVANKLKGKLDKAEIVDGELHVTLEEEDLSKSESDE